MTPTWTLTADGADLTAALQAYLLSIAVTDKAGMEADELEVLVADPRAELAVPAVGATLAVSLGYQQTGLTPLGTFIVDTLELASPPRQLLIRAHGADITGDLLTRKTKGWEDTTVASIVGTIAGAHGLQAAVGAALQGRAIKRFDQTNESDIAFLTRLGTLYDAIVTIKEGRVIFTPRGQGTSAAGAAIGAVTLTPADVTQWRFSTTSQGVATTVEARVYDPATATATVISAGVPAQLPAKAQRYANAFATAEAKYGLPTGLLAGVAKTESSFNPTAGSPAGAQGLMQFMPATAARFGLTNRHDPIASIDAAGKYLKWLQNHYGGNLDNAIRAYNAGEGKVDRWLAGKTTLKQETINYLPKVKAAQRQFATGAGPVQRLRPTFQDPALAQTAATSSASASVRGATTLSLSLPGNPLLAAETPIELEGFDPAIDGRWVVTSCLHALTGQGYTCTVDAEQTQTQAPTVQTMTI